MGIGPKTRNTLARTCSPLKYFTSRDADSLAAVETRNSPAIDNGSRLFAYQKEDTNCGKGIVSFT